MKLASLTVSLEPLLASSTELTNAFNKIKACRDALKRPGIDYWVHDSVFVVHRDLAGAPSFVIISLVCVMTDVIVNIAFTRCSDQRRFTATTIGTLDACR